jgi:hypothetical protein
VVDAYNPHPNPHSNPDSNSNSNSKPEWAAQASVVDAYKFEKDALDRWLAKGREAMRKAGASAPMVELSRLYDRLERLKVRSTHPNSNPNPHPNATLTRWYDRLERLKVRSTHPDPNPNPHPNPFARLLERLRVR